METRAALRSGGALPQRAAAAAEGPLYPGRTLIHDRVILKVVEEATSTLMGVDRGKVNVRISAVAEGMTVSIASPLPVPRLDDDVAIAAMGSIMSHIAVVQEGLREQIGRITGRPIARVNITITGAIISEVRRVK